MTLVSTQSKLADCFGLCVFGRSVTGVRRKFIADTITVAFDAFDTDMEESRLIKISHEALRLKGKFNGAAGFAQEQDELFLKFLAH